MISHISAERLNTDRCMENVQHIFIVSCLNAIVNPCLFVLFFSLEVYIYIYIYLTPNIQ